MIRLYTEPCGCDQLSVTALHPKGGGDAESLARSRLTTSWFDMLSSSSYSPASLRLALYNVAI